jgi:hypothetical protein
LGSKGSEDLKNALVTIGNDYFKQWEGLDDKPVRFMYSIDETTNPLEKRIRQILKLADGPQLLVINLPEQVKYPFKGEINGDTMKTFIADYIAGKVDAVGLNE